MSVIDGGSHIRERESGGRGKKRLVYFEPPGSHHAGEELMLLLLRRSRQLKYVVESTEQRSVERMATIGGSDQQTVALVGIEQLKERCDNALHFAYVVVIEPRATECVELVEEIDTAHPGRLREYICKGCRRLAEVLAEDHFEANPD